MAEEAGDKIVISTPKVIERENTTKRFELLKQTNVAIGKDKGPLIETEVIHYNKERRMMATDDMVCQKTEERDLILTTGKENIIKEAVGRGEAQCPNIYGGQVTNHSGIGPGPNDKVQWFKRTRIQRRKRGKSEQMEEESERRRQDLKKIKRSWHQITKEKEVQRRWRKMRRVKRHWRRGGKYWEILQPMYWRRLMFSPTAINDSSELELSGAWEPPGSKSFEGAH